MAVFDSPLTLVLLVVTMVLVVAVAAAQHSSLYRVAGLLPDDSDERSPQLRQHVVASACAVLLVLLFWLALGLLSPRQDAPAPASLRASVEEARTTDIEQGRGEPSLSRP